MVKIFLTFTFTFTVILVLMPFTIFSSTPEDKYQSQKFPTLPEIAKMTILKWENSIDQYEEALKIKYSKPYPKYETTWESMPAFSIPLNHFKLLKQIELEHMTPNHTLLHPNQSF